jgi:hypothetical protein
MEVPTVTEVRRPARGTTPARVGWRLTAGDAEPLGGDEMLLDDVCVEAAAVQPALALWMRDPADANSWDVRDSDEIGGLASALELVDETGAHRAFAVGPVHPFSSTAGRAVRLWVGGELLGEDELLADYAETVRATQRRLDQRGDALRPGDFLLTGAFVRAPVLPGDRVQAEIAGLDRLAVEIAR